jgi:DNA-binding HxlR family transcriptional regulator
MTKTRYYGHFCVVARALEVIGDKWSLLIVRDLLRGRQRFTDLRRYLGSITPKWLTLRLRELEVAGLVERDQEAGRREVWYGLTPKGRDLAPVVEALAMWGIQHAMRPPLPGEPVYPELTMSAMALFLNKQRMRLPSEATWLFRFSPGGVHTVHFDGERWSTHAGEEEADVTVTTTPEAWVTLLATRSPRDLRPESTQIEGAPSKIAEFSRILGAGVQ